MRRLENGLLVAAIFMAAMFVGPTTASADPGPRTGTATATAADPDAAIIITRRGGPSSLVLTARQIDRFGLSPKETQQIDKASIWARAAGATQSRACRSGNTYGLSSLSGREGAYQLTTRQWQTLGGHEIAAGAADAPRWAQDWKAWLLWRDSAWQRLDCPSANWMDWVYQHESGTPISQLIIPGAHDAGAAGIRVEPPCTTQLIDGAPSEYEIASRINPCGTAALARAQDLSLGEQLRSGVRYLDLRVGVPADEVIPAPRQYAGNPKNVPLVLHHEFVSQPLVDGLRQILRFAQQHPREQVILDFQHVTLPPGHGITRYYRHALDGLLSNSHLVGGATVCESAWTRGRIGVDDTDLGRVTVQRAWDVDRNLLLLFKPDQIPQRGCFRDRSAALLSIWPNTDDPATSKNDNLSYLKDRRQAMDSGDCVDGPDNWCGIFVSQLQLSFQLQHQIDCVVNGGPLCSLAEYAGLVNDRVAERFHRWRFRRDLPVNIAMVDFIEQSDPSIVRGLIADNWQQALTAPQH